MGYQKCSTLDTMDGKKHLHRCDGWFKVYPIFFKGLHMFQGDAGVLPSTQDFFWPVFFVCP